MEPLKDRPHPRRQHCHPDQVARLRGGAPDRLHDHDREDERDGHHGDVLEPQQDQGGPARMLIDAKK